MPQHFLVCMFGASVRVNRNPFRIECEWWTKSNGGKRAKHARHVFIIISKPNECKQSHFWNIKMIYCIPFCVTYLHFSIASQSTTSTQWSAAYILVETGVSSTFISMRSVAHWVALLLRTPSVHNSIGNRFQIGGWIWIHTKSLSIPGNEWRQC